MRPQRGKPIPMTMADIYDGRYFLACKGDKPPANMRVPDPTGAAISGTIG